jgi:hypothetical protein
VVDQPSYGLEAESRTKYEDRAEAEDYAPPGRPADSRAVAEYLADMIDQLESMARLAGFDMLTYLLSMARAEAENNARAGDGRY